MVDFEKSRADFDALIRRVAVVAVALFILVPTSVKITNLITKPHLPPGRAHLFEDLQDGPAADRLAASWTAQLRPLYPGTVVVDNGELDKSGTYMFTVHSPEHLSPDQLRGSLPGICSIRVKDLVTCHRRGSIPP